MSVGTMGCVGLMVSVGTTAYVGMYAVTTVSARTTAYVGTCAGSTGIGIPVSTGITGRVRTGPTALWTTGLETEL
ncbi:hypothetical protein BG418_31290 [Streptomyces sp. CBMA152]|nr:hypothetical protein [Streptomyces sp. CBMA152]